MKEDKNYLLLAQSYLKTSKLLLEEMLISKNIRVVISDAEILEDEYELKTRYSDFNTMLPAMFIFYHGIEILIKGMLFDDKFELSHDSSRLLVKLKEIEKNSCDYVDVVSTYIVRPLKIKFLDEYLGDNDINKIERIYESFRYPSVKGIENFVCYDSMRYRGESILGEIKIMIDDIDIILKGAVHSYNTRVNQ